MKQADPKDQRQDYSSRHATGIWRDNDTVYKSIVQGKEPLFEHLVFTNTLLHMNLFRALLLSSS